jgi:hypothetical protein
MGLLILLLSGVDFSVADDDDDRATKFTAIDFACEKVQDGAVTVDPEGVIHIEGDIFKGIVVSDNTLIAGTSLTVADAVIEPNSDVTQLWVTAFYYPNAVQGTWIAPGQGQASPEGLRVRHSGHGTRALRKSLIRLIAQTASDFGTPPCEPVLPPTELKGVIIKR